MTPHIRAAAARWFIASLQLGCLLFAAVWLGGCSKEQSPGELAPGELGNGGAAAGETAPNGKAGPRLTSAEEVLKAMAKAYYQAKTYEDSGQFRLKFARGDEAVNEAADFSVTFSRPNKLRMHAYQAIVVCDGDKFRATIADLANQVLEKPAPEKLNVLDVFSDPVLLQTVTTGIVGAPMPLGLLLDKNSLEPILLSGEAPALLDDKKIDDRTCYGVEIKREDGELRFWIDQQTLVLRRLEYPTGPMLAHLEQQGGPKPTGLSLIAEFKGARFNHSIEDVAFEFELPAEAKLVERFNVRPPPSELLGQKVKDFTFVNMDGKPLSRADLAGKTVVIDFWATWCGWCFKSLPHLQYVYDEYKDNDQVVFLAVSTDAPEIKDDKLKESFDKAELKLPMYRDLDRYCDSTFQVKGLPTMVILGPDGTIQAHDAGYQPQLASELPVKLEKLLAGESIYEQAIQEYEQGGKIDPAEGNIRLAEIAERSEPARLKLNKLWACAEVARPGNFLVVPQGGQDQILVIDSWRNVIELAADGKVAARHELDLPKQAEDSIVSFLRTAVDSAGKRYFAASAVSVQQLHLFDEQWNTLLNFPEGKHGGITDVELADLDGDGQPEMNVGYWGEAGLQNVSLSGERLWSNRSLDNVLRLAVVETSGRRELLATSLHGSLVPFDAQGKEGKPIVMPNRFIRFVYAADLDGDGQSEVCAIAQGKLDNGNLGPDVAVGLSPQGDELWTYDLPPGIHPEAALEMVQFGKLLPGDAAQWVIAGADGSVHILSASGEEIDRYNTGVAISGLAVAQIGGQGALLVASEKGVEAWRVAP
jgi:thiol-disulfide isomerase/thioredoxin